MPVETDTPDDLAEQRRPWMPDWTAEPQHRRTIALVLITLIALVTIGIRLGDPEVIQDGEYNYVFDEVYYVRDARCQLAQGGVENGRPVHPPVGKWFIGAGIRAHTLTLRAGDALGVVDPEMPPPRADEQDAKDSCDLPVTVGDNEVGWRLAGMLAGALIVLLTMLIGLQLGLRTSYAATAGLLVLTDGLFFVQSRTAMLDIYLALFVAAGAWAFTKDLSDDRPETFARPWRVATAAFLGLATAVKWSGAFVIPAVLVLIAGFEARRTRERLAADGIALAPRTQSQWIALWIAYPGCAIVGLLFVVYSTAAGAGTDGAVPNIIERALSFGGFAGLLVGSAVAAAMAALLEPRVSADFVASRSAAASSSEEDATSAHDDSEDDDSPRDWEPDDGPTFYYPWRRAVAAAVTVGALSVAVYGLTWIPWMISYEHTYQASLNEPWSCPGAADNDTQCEVGVVGRTRGLVAHHLDVLKFHRDLEGEHSYRAGAWTWPVLKRPVVYSYDSCDGPREVDEDPCVVDEGNAAEVIGLGNPALWWGLTLLAPGILAAAGRRRLMTLVPVVFWLSLVLPWLRPNRPIFIFYVVPAIPFMAMAVAALFQDAEESPPQPIAWVWGATGAGAGLIAGHMFFGGDARWSLLIVGAIVGSVAAGRWGPQPTYALWRGRGAAPVVARRTALGLTVVAVALFVYFYPVLAGIELSADVVRQRWWFESWI